MKIPISFTVGSTDYTVQQPRSIPGGAWGRVYLDMGVILVATHSMGQPRPTLGNNGRHQTFWHEATHAILNDMGHSLCNDELFVNTFSKRLNQLIETARLEP